MTDTGKLQARILVVDDSKLIRVTAEKILQDDYEVVLAEDGEQAWDAISQDDSIRVVFSDLTMPRLDGFSLLKRVRKSDVLRISQLPLIIMTTDADEEARRETALQLGATDFISKPFNSIDLKARAKAHVTSELINQELKQKAELYERSASRDPLTGLNNKSYLLDRLAQDSSYALRHRTPLAVIRLDLSGFNQVFVLHGKEAGSQLVCQLAGRITQVVRQEDTAARTGVSTFVLVLPGATTTEAEALVSELRKLLDEAEAGIPDVSPGLNAVILAPDVGESGDADTILEQLEQHANELLMDTDRDTEVVNLQQPSVADADSTEVSVDAVLQAVMAGQQDKVRHLLPVVVNRLEPVIREFDENTRAKLLEKLQK